MLILSGSLALAQEPAPGAAGDPAAEERLRRQQELIQRRVAQKRQHPARQPGEQGAPQNDNGTLWPGSSYTYDGVTITWRLPEDAKTTRTLSWEKLGRLVIADGDRSINLEMPFRGYGNGRPGRQTTVRVGNRDLALNSQVYFGQVVMVFGIETRGTNEQPLFAVTYMVRPQDATFPVTAAPGNFEAYVSSHDPIEIGPLRLSVSEKPVRQPGGADLHELRVSEAGAASVSMPLVANNERSFGRFKLAIGGFWPESATAMLSTNVDADLTARGAEAFVAPDGRHDIYPPDVNNQQLTVKDFLDHLSKQFQFEVEWVEFPKGHPESIPEAQNRPLHQIPYNAGHLLKDILPFHLDRNGLAFEWKDSTHLRVWAKDFDKVVAEREAAEQAEKSREAEGQAFTARFEQEYPVSLKSYKLEKISAATAKALIDPELHDYYLLRIIRQNFGWLVVLQEGKHHTIAMNPRKETPKMLEEQYKLVVKSVKESSIIDTKSNSLLVTATPKTQEKVASMIANMEGMIETPKQPTGPVRQYPIEAALLKLGKVAEPAVKVQEQETTFSLGRMDKGYFQGAEIWWTAAELQKTADNQSSLVFNMSVDPPSGGKRIFLTLRDFEPARVGNFEIAVDQKHFDLRKFIADTSSMDKPPFRVRAINPTPPASGTAQRYGLSDADLKMFGFDAASEMGKAMTTLAGEKGAAGKALVSLTENYRLELQFEDERAPYVIVKGSLLGGEGDKPLLSNTLFLEKDKPAVLGLTNLREALVLVVKLR